MYHAYSQPSPFPPSFEGNPFAYAFGLFGDVVAAAIGLALLAAIVLEPRRRKQIGEQLGISIHTAPLPPWSVLRLYRTHNIALLTFVVMRSLPDALWMLLWGEVSEPTIKALLTLDLWCDGLALAPFMLAAVCWAIGRQTIEQLMVSRSAVPAGMAFPWDVVLRSGRIVVVVVIIAIGVTIGKASA